MFISTERLKGSGTEPNIRIKNLMHFLQMKKLSPSSENLATKETSNLSLKLLLIRCTNHEEPLLQSSTSNVDFFELLWEDFTFQIDNRDHKKQEMMYYPIFIKAIIHHFITKDKSISMRNIMFMHTAEDDNILGPMRFVSKVDNYQVYGKLLPKVITNQMMQDSDAYKTYLALALWPAIFFPKKARKFKKLASPSRKRTLVTVEEEEPEPAKKVAPSKKSSRK
ncbi:hypothetical protein Tco_0449479 [Tanacetum coccineum]